MKVKSTLAVWLLICCLHSCDSMNELAFDKVAWIEDGREGNYPEKRDRMLSDLLENHPLKGKTYREIQHLLGNTAMSDRSVNYNVVTDFRSNIDPMYTKDLTIYFSRDSVVTGYEVKEWDREAAN